MCRDDGGVVHVILLDSVPDISSGAYGFLGCAVNFLWSYQSRMDAGRIAGLVYVTNADGEQVNCMGCIASGLG